MKKLYTPNYWEGRDGHDIEDIVLHYTVGNKEETLNTVTNSYSQVSYHYLVDRQGEIIQLVDDEDSAWANGRVIKPIYGNLKFDDGEIINPNKYTLSIAAIVPSNKIWSVPRWKQWKTWAKFVEEKSEEHDAGVIEHNYIRSDKFCPGHYFNRYWLNILNNYF